jgi:hypothetical protein
MTVCWLKWGVGEGEYSSIVKIVEEECMWRSFTLLKFDLCDFTLSGCFFGTTVI